MPTVGNKRECGDCQLCCRLVPVKELAKPANTKCEYQRHGKGCLIYGRHPLSCRVWSCGWLLDPDLRDLRRPDRSHYVVDPTPDYVVLTYDDKDNLPPRRIRVLQIWIDPAHPEAYQDPTLYALLEAHEAVALVRFGNERSILVWPPSRSPTGEWMEEHSDIDPNGEKDPAKVAALIAAGEIE